MKSNNGNSPGVEPLGSSEFWPGRVDSKVKQSPKSTNSFPSLLSTGGDCCPFSEIGRKFISRRKEGHVFSGILRHPGIRLLDGFVGTINSVYCVDITTICQTIDSHTLGCSFVPWFLFRNINTHGYRYYVIMLFFYICLNAHPSIPCLLPLTIFMS